MEVFGVGKKRKLMLWREEKGRAFKPHYMHAVKPQADDAYVDLRTTAVNKSNEMVRETKRWVWKKIRPRKSSRHQNDASIWWPPKTGF